MLMKVGLKHREECAIMTGVIKNKSEKTYKLSTSLAT